MRYIKSFEKFNAGDINSIINDEDIIYPTGIEITGHIQTPVRSVRVQKIGKSPKVKSKKPIPNYTELQKRNSKETTLLNSLPSQS